MEDYVLATQRANPYGTCVPPFRQCDIVDSHPPELGAKFDSGKLRFSLLTRGLAISLRRVAEVLTYGANKYSANSWQSVPNAKERYEDALDRHLNSWKLGEIRDPESGLPHLAHIATNALFLLWFYKDE